MYTLRNPSNNSFICCIDSDTYDCRIILRDLSGKEIGYGTTESHAVTVGCIHLFETNGTPVGTLEREWGIDGKPNCVRFSNSLFSKSIPLDEFENPYIVSFLFGDAEKYLNNPSHTDNVIEEKPNMSGPPDTSGPSVSFNAPVALLVPLFFISFILIAVFRKTILRYEDIVTRILVYYVPILAGIIMILICLFHRGGGLSLRIAGLIEGVSVALFLGIVLWFSCRGIATVGDFLYSKGMEILNASTGFASVLYGIGFAIFMFLLMMLPFFLLAIVLRIVSSRVRVVDSQYWLKRLNLKFFGTIMICGTILFYFAFLIYQSETVGKMILLGIFYGFLLAFTSLGVGALSVRILSK